MKTSLKRILPIVLAIVIICSIGWYLFVYDTDFTRDLLLKQARMFESNGNHTTAAWFYDLAYRHSGNSEVVVTELAEQFKANGNYSKAEYVLSNAIAKGGSVELYIALCKTYVEQDKLLDAVTMLDNVADPQIKAQLDSLRPSAPEATPAPGFYNQYINVTIESSSGTLYAAADGEYPSTQKDRYENGVTLAAGENTIYAVSVAESGLVSPLSILGYTVGGVIEEVTFSDSALDALIREKLGMDAEDKLLTSDLWDITDLVMPQTTEDYKDLQYFPYLTSLTIDKGSFTSLQNLSSLPQLTKLSVTGSNLSAQDLLSIAALPNLKELTLSGCMLSSIQNLSGAQKLEYLDLSNNTIRDASALSFMSGLKHLDLSHNALTNLSYLSALNGLTKLNVSYNSLASLVPLASCTALTELDVSHNSIGSLSGVESLGSLVKFNAGYNNLTEADLLSGLSNLVELTLCHNTLLDINSLSSLVKLQYLDFSYNEIENLPQWPASCAMVHINGAYNKLKTVDALAGYSQLNTVIMDYNSDINSVDALASCPYLIRVDVSGTAVKDVSKLQEQSIIVNYTPA